MAMGKGNCAAALEVGSNESVVRCWRLLQGELAKSVSDDTAAGTLTSCGHRAAKHHLYCITFGLVIDRKKYTAVCSIMAAAFLAFCNQ